MSKIHKAKKWHFAVEMEYEDGSAMNFEVSLEESAGNELAVIMMITRGTLMACGAVRGTAYDEDGFDVVSYTK